jgi:hypothetical protein
LLFEEGTNTTANNGQTLIYLPLLSSMFTCLIFSRTCEERWLKGCVLGFVGLEKDTKEEIKKKITRMTHRKEKTDLDMYFF